MQALYQIDISGAKPEEALENLFEDGISDETRKFSAELVQGTVGDIKKIDADIAKYSKDWPVSRMSVIDRNILRLAFYEITSEKGTPEAVAADEAVELAKKYGTARSAKFINGILGSLIKDVSKVVK